MKKGGTRAANSERVSQLIVLCLVPITRRKLDKSLTSPFTSGKSSCPHGLTVSGVSAVPQAAPGGAAGGGAHAGGGGGETSETAELCLEV